MTQNDIHVRHLTDLVDMLEAERLRDRVVLVAGGARVDHALAKELGYDAGFGPGTTASPRRRLSPRGDLPAARRRAGSGRRDATTVLLRLRVGAEQAHYGGGLVDGAFVLKLFGDAATELLVRHDGDEGLFRAYSSVDFLAPVRGGDYLEVEAEITRVGRTSRADALRGAQGHRARRRDRPRASLDPPEVVARATGTCVVPAREAGRPRVSDALLITVAGVGAEVMRAQQPHLPLLPDEVGEEYARAHDAGATIGHVHGRRPDGTPTQDLETFRAYSAAIRARCPIIQQFSTGGAVGMGVEERIAALELKPEMATLTLGTCNFGDDIFENSLPTIRTILDRIRKFGITPELEIFDDGMLATADVLFAKGLLDAARPLRLRARRARRRRGDRREPDALRPLDSGGLHLDRRRNRAAPDRDGHDGDRDGRPRARRVRGQHLLPQGRARRLQRPLRRARRPDRARGGPRARHRSRRRGRSCASRPPRERRRTPRRRGELARGLGLWDTSLLVLGLVIGGGIFLTPSVDREGHPGRDLDPRPLDRRRAARRSPAASSTPRWAP